MKLLMILMGYNKLALFGGHSIVSDHKNIRISWPIVRQSDFNQVKRAFFDKDFSGRGSKRVEELEKKFEERYKGRFATAVNSGTSALHLALKSLNIGPGDEVIVPALTFVASAMSVLHNQSIPIFADIDPCTYNISPDSVLKKITKKTKAIIVVHLHGLPADMKRIQSICRKYNLKLIEDVAQAPGAKYFGKEVGLFGDAAIFSFMSQKNLATCGEAGLLLSRGIKAKNRAEITRIYGEIIKKNNNRVYNSYTLGWNYTLNPIQATMLMSQLKNFDIVTRRIQVMGRKLNDLLKTIDWVLPPVEPARVTSVFHFYRFGLQPEILGYKKIGRFRQAIQDALNAEGLNVRHYQNTPIPGQSFFQNINYKKDYPWILSDRKIEYKITDYPNTLNVISSTLVLGAISSTPGYLLCPGSIEKYFKGFIKINKNIDKILEYADKIDYHDPWEELSKVSDSYMSKYGLYEGK